MPVSLDEILSSTRRALPDLHGRRDDLERAIQSSHVARPSFRAALRKSSVAVIAEVKRRSPSAGVIRDDLKPGDRAALYAAHGAAAISVLTDGPYFGGSVHDLSEAVSRCPLPLLRKDFILDEVQVLEARAAGASAVLLIVRALDQSRLRLLLESAGHLGLDCLVEVHTARELEQALDCGAEIIGVNSRDLDTFAIDVTGAWKILARIPSDKIAVAESGLLGQSDVLRAAQAGADAVLVGTALSAAESPGPLLRSLTGIPRHGR